MYFHCKHLPAILLHVYMYIHTVCKASCWYDPIFIPFFFLQSFASPVALKEVEDKIRKAVHARNVRLTEYFKDFDRLRTGFITSKLFKSLSR